MSCKDKEIHDTLIPAGMLPETISMEECMKLLRALKAEIEIQHNKEMQNMVRLDEAEDIIENCIKSKLGHEFSFLYLMAFIKKDKDPDNFKEWDETFLTAIEKQKQASQEPETKEPCTDFKWHKSGKCLVCGKIFEEHIKKQASQTEKK